MQIINRNKKPNKEHTGEFLDDFKFNDKDSCVTNVGSMLPDVADLQAA